MHAYNSTFVPPFSAPVYIVCAALRWHDRDITIPAPRHLDPMMHKLIQANGLSDTTHEAKQGFIDQWGRFYSRRAAWKIAEEQNQIRRRVGGDTTDGGTLYSENLY